MDPPLQQGLERRDPVVYLGGVRVLGRATVVQHERCYPGRLRDVRGELPVAGRRADGEPAAVRVEEDLGAIGSGRERPDAGHAADRLLLVGDIFRFDGRLMPFIEDAAEQPHVQLVSGHELGPAQIQITQGARDDCGRGG